MVIVAKLCDVLLDRFSSCCWISEVGSGGWDIRVKGVLTPRPDGRINSSPVTSAMPIVRLQQGCGGVIRIPGKF